jgi:tripartite-type tricarboxylate transporter receptor subunit TctC
MHYAISAAHRHHQLPAFAWLLALLGYGLHSTHACAAGVVAAADYPLRPLRMLVPFPAGGGADITARIVAEKLSETLRTQIIVDNRAGAGGNVAGVIAARAPADGYTLYTITASTAVNAALYTQLGYDLMRDFSPVIQISALPYTLAVQSSSPLAGVKELLAQARLQPGIISFGSNGLGGLSHVAGELLAARSNTKLLHVPYKGGAQALTDVISGQITMLFATPLLSLPHVRSGRIRLLAVTSAKRAPSLPEVPSIAESGVPGYAVSSWNGILVPKATPAAIITKLNITTALVLDTERARLSKDGSEVSSGTPAEFGALIRADIEQWKKLAVHIGLQAQ